MFADGVPMNAEHDLLGDLKAAALALKTRAVGIMPYADGSYGISTPFREPEKHLTLVPPSDAPDAA